MLRTVLLMVAILASCQFTELDSEDRRSEKVPSWVTPGEEVTGSGFVRRNDSDAYGAPYVMVWEGYADFDPAKQYAIEEGEFVHRCGEDANVSREFALVSTTNELTIARNFQGVRGFDKIPDGVVRIQALVFSDRACRVTHFAFTVLAAKLVTKSPQDKCEEIDGMVWNGNACIKGPRLLCEQKPDHVFVEDQCLPQSAGPAPALLLSTAWRQQDGELQWIFKFDESGEGVFGFKAGDLTVQSGEVAAHTDFSIDEQHVVVSVGAVDDLPADAPWEANTLYYCHLRFMGDENSLMEWNCSPGGENVLPSVSSSVMQFEAIAADDTDLSPTQP